MKKNNLRLLVMLLCTSMFDQVYAMRGIVEKAPESNPEPDEEQDENGLQGSTEIDALQRNNDSNNQSTSRSTSVANQPTQIPQTVTLKQLQASFNTVRQQTNNTAVSALSNTVQSANQAMVADRMSELNMQTKVLQRMFTSGDTEIAAQELDAALKTFSQKIASLAGLRDTLQAAADTKAVDKLNQIIENASALKEQVEKYGTPSGDVSVVEVEPFDNTAVPKSDNPLPTYLTKSLDDMNLAVSRFTYGNAYVDEDQSTLITQVNNFGDTLQRVLTKSFQVKEYLETFGDEFLDAYNNALDALLNNVSFDVAQQYGKNLETIQMQVTALITKMKSVLSPDQMQSYTEQIESLQEKNVDLTLQNELINNGISDQRAIHQQLTAAPNSWYGRLWNNMKAFFPRKAGKDASNQAVTNAVDTFKNSGQQVLTNVQEILQNAVAANRSLTKSEQVKMNMYLDVLVQQKKVLNDFSQEANVLGGQFSVRHNLETVVRQAAPIVDQHIASITALLKFGQGDPEPVADMLEADLQAGNETPLVSMFKNDMDLSTALIQAIRTKYIPYSSYSWLADGVKHGGETIDIKTESSLNQLLTAVNLTKEQVLAMSQEEFAAAVDASGAGKTAGIARDWNGVAAGPNGFAILKELLAHNGRVTDSMQQQINKGNNTYQKLLKQQITLSDLLFNH